MSERKLTWGLVSAAAHGPQPAVRPWKPLGALASSSFYSCPSAFLTDKTSQLIARVGASRLRARPRPRPKLAGRAASPRGRTFHAMVSVMAVKIQFSSPRGVLRSFSRPGILGDTGRFR